MADKKPKSPAKAVNDATQKVFDVARPGKSAATPSSKPVLISNRPLMRDPMVNETPTEDTPAEPTVKTTTQKLVIKPIHDDVVPEADDDSTKVNVKTTKSAADDATPPATDTEKPAEEAAPAAEEPAEPATTPEPTASTTEEAPAEPETIEFSKTVKGVPTKNPEASDNQVTPAYDLPSDTKPVAVPATDSASESTGKTGPAINELTANKNDGTNGPDLSADEAQAALKAAQAHIAALQTIIDKQKYFLPINGVEERRSKRFALIGLVLIILLGLAWADIALDAGLINNAHNFPHTHFFSSK